ncbi:MAG TPA: sensor histidine kinase, partial [Candidatus Limnocylindria bacterium]
AIVLRWPDRAERVVASVGVLSDAPPTTVHGSPLLSGDAAIGTLTVRWRRPGVEPGLEEGELLDALANQAAVAIERDNLRSEVRQLAIRGERERIAREMHDGLAQVLGYVNTKALAVEELLASDRPADARRQLAELSAAARSVYVDVREAILGLTSAIAVERGLVGAIEEYVSRFAGAAKIAASVNATDEARRLRLAPETEGEVFRVVREALTNVRKHASAHRVVVDLSAAGGSLAVRVTDDGVGLDVGGPASRDWPHYGMRMMRERAEALGGAVTWASAPTGGTVFDLRLPLTPQPALR